MAYTYTPYEYEAGIGRPRYDASQGEWITPSYGQSSQTGPEWDIAEANRQRTQFQDYAGEQFKGLFDIANLNPNPLQGFTQTPTYSPYSGTRGDFTTSGQRYHSMTPPEGVTPPSYGWHTAPDVFDQEGYLDARFGNINDYLSGLSSFLGNISGDSSAAVRQAEVQRAIQQANMPKVGSLSGYGGTPQVGGLSGFSQTAPGSNYGGWGGRQVSGGWGSHPVAGGLLGFGGNE